MFSTTKQSSTITTCQSFDFLFCFFKKKSKIINKRITKEKLLATFRDWKFMEYLMDVASSNKHGDDIATKYATFFIDLVARSASIEEAAIVFHGHEHLIVDSMLKALLDEDNTRTLWHRIVCGQTLVQFLDICSRPTIINPAQAYTDMLGLVPIEPSPNVLHQMFDVCLCSFMSLRHFAQIYIYVQNNKK
ncbi:hypothetical protein RFI_36397 [Reticulomyxa filosa]|uniref:Uncharacterized protein n=1 Tax=Reticulomyxa filosa TaxID=46433 RepID=X6LJZ6_RETFI|nr:hypothetical protein RFI_36397 [Reticulomyxa filosa]|eukprot:ETO01045.1 hypothetical protein RFI_36397 [Reticulomyxa filosa]